MNKSFDKELFDENDNVAKLAVANYLEKTFEVKVFDGGMYGVDLYVAYENQMISVIEVERRANWKNEFPFKTVHVPLRKKKYFNYPFLPSFLFSVKFDCTEALYCDGKTILNSPVIEIDNKYMSDEPFFDVCIDEWERVKLC